MTSKKSTGQSNSGRYSTSLGTPDRANMVEASQSAWSAASGLSASRSSFQSRQRVNDARNELLQSEREYISASSEIERSLNSEAVELQRKTHELNAEIWGIEKEAETRVRLLKIQAQMELKLANKIREIADRNALAMLDRMKEASDSLMDWAGEIGTDMTDMMKQEAAGQMERQVADIKAIEEAIGQEDRAAELLQLTARYRQDSAA